MVLNHTNDGAQPRRSSYQTMGLTRTTDGARRSQYSDVFGAPVDDHCAASGFVSQSIIGRSFVRLRRESLRLVLRRLNRRDRT